MRVLIALACILPLVAATTFVWKGANTNWNEKSNWQGTVPLDGCPASLDLTGSSFANKPTITSRLDGTVVAGSSIKFPSNGRIILSDASKIKFNPECTEASAVFVGGFTNTKENSINCRSNYLVNGKAPVRVPCEGDDIVIPATQTVRLWSSERVNVDSITFGTTDFETCQAISADSSVASQLSGVTCGRNGNFLLNDAQPCKDAKEINDEGDCICFENPECLSEEDIRKQAQLEREAAEELARIARDALAVNVTKTFSGTLTAALLGVDASDLLFIKEDSEILSAFLLDLRQRLADEWGVPLSQVQVPKFEIADGGIQVTIEGTVTAPKSAFLEPGQDPDTVTSGPIDLVGQQLTQLQQIIRSAIGEAILQNSLDVYGRQIAVLLAACGTAPECADANEVLKKLADVFVDPAKVYDAIKDCNDMTCVNNELGSSELVKKTSSTEEDFQALLDALSKIVPITAAGNVDTFLDQATDIATAANQAADRQAALPKDTTFDSPLMEVGQNRPRVDLAHIVSTTNQPNLKLAISFALSPYLTLKRVNGATISFDLKFPTTIRRAITNDDLPLAIIVQFKYVSACNSVDTRNCGFKAGDAVFKDVQKRINNIIDVFVATSHSKCFDFQTGYDESCLQKEATTAYTNAMKAKLGAAAALAAAKAAVVTIAECGDYGRKPVGGACVYRDPEIDTVAANYAQKAQASYQAPTDNNNGGGNEASTGGSGGGGLPIAVIAGAAGGGLLVIIIIVIVVMRRKKSAGGDKQTDNRTVVAFENPMYDDPNQNANANYEATPDHGEGLYDEPAYNAQSSLAKANPMYESTENMAANTEEGGYLDVAPEDQ